MGIRVRAVSTPSAAASAMYRFQSTTGIGSETRGVNEGAAEGIRTPAKSLEGSCAATTPQPPGRRNYTSECWPQGRTSQRAALGCTATLHRKHALVESFSAGGGGLPGEGLEHALAAARPPLAQALAVTQRFV